MGLYHVAAVLKEHGCEVEVLNWHDIAAIPRSSSKRRCCGRSGRRSIGFSILHANRWGGIEIARIAKRLDPETTVVFGGVGATHLWEHLAAARSRRSITSCVGEGEHAFLSLVRRIDGRGPVAMRPPSRASPCAQTAGPSGRPTAEPIRDLDALPMPARYFDLRAPVPDPGLRRRTARFCGSPGLLGPPGPLPLGGLFRRAARGPARAAASRFFYVSDDTFTLNRQPGDRRLPARSSQRRLGIHWAAISRVDAVDEEVLAWMRRAGCIQISYGVESGSEAIRRRLNKTISATQIRAGLRANPALRHHGPGLFHLRLPRGNPGRPSRKRIDLMLEIQPLARRFLHPGSLSRDGALRRLQAPQPADRRHLARAGRGHHVLRDRPGPFRRADPRVRPEACGKLLPQPARVCGGP
ncbi:MAG: cobalamin-dependent protein [Desulfobacterales bacterium]|nr:cobalamin-dependent protein [Desulfobacterales bacterium]